eukprot:UN3763
MWFNNGGDDFDWTRREGPTPTKRTGPSEAMHGDYYLYLETSAPRKFGDKAILKSRPFVVGKETHLRIAFHMYGRSTGQLEVLIGGQTILKREGNHGDRWITINISLRRFRGQSIDIEVVGHRGRSVTGDIAIDTLQIIKAASLPSP